MKFLAVNTMKNTNGSLSELAAVLWDTKSQTVWDDYSHITDSVSDDDQPAIPEELRKERGQKIDSLVSVRLAKMAEKAEFFVSYGNFYNERLTLQKALNKKGIAGVEKNWCHLVDDLKVLSGLSQPVGLAEFLRHDQVDICLPLPRRCASRALAIAQATQVFLEEVTNAIKSPLYVVKADVSYEDRELAKRAGFRWENLHDEDERRFEKSWVKVIRRNQIDNLGNKAGFALIEIERL